MWNDALQGHSYEIREVQVNIYFILPHDFLSHVNIHIFKIRFHLLFFFLLAGGNGLSYFCLSSSCKCIQSPCKYKWHYQYCCLLLKPSVSSRTYLKVTRSCNRSSKHMMGRFCPGWCCLDRSGLSYVSASRDHVCGAARGSPSKFLIHHLLQFILLISVFTVFTGSRAATVSGQTQNRWGCRSRCCVSDVCSGRCWHCVSVKLYLISSCQAADMMSPKLLTLVLVVRPGRVLLGMKKRGFGVGKWNGFGGKVQQGETIEEGARR